MGRARWRRTDLGSAEHGESAKGGGVAHGDPLGAFTRPPRARPYCQGVRRDGHATLLIDPVPRIRTTLLIPSLDSAARQADHEEARLVSARIVRVLPEERTPSRCVFVSRHDTLADAELNRLVSRQASTGTAGTRSASAFVLRTTNIRSWT